jgi:hypothetical protein
MPERTHCKAVVRSSPADRVVPPAKEDQRGDEVILIVKEQPGPAGESQERFSRRGPDFLTEARSSSANEFVRKAESVREAKS